MKDACIVSNYGIGCNGEVGTVVLFANVDKSKLTKIYLDNHSRTSVELLKIIVSEFWNLEIEFERKDVELIELKEGEGVLMIGDKVFENDQRFKIKYDLGKIWKEHTSLPFVFAVWVSKKEQGLEIKERLEPILSNALDAIPGVIEKMKSEYLWDVKSYFERNIVYTIGEDGLKAIKLFDEKLKSNKSSVMIEY